MQKILAGIAALTSVLSLSAQKQKLPNIVLIYTDDQGYADLGCFGAKGFSTPHIDSLAENGIRFTNFYAPQAVSSASRAGLLTGCYPNRVGISGALSPGAKIGLNPDETTIAELLKQKGYATAAFGKWHLGRPAEFLPTHQGFDEYFGIPYSVDMIPMEYDGSPIDTTKRKSKYPMLPVLEGDKVISSLNTLPGIDTLTRFLTEKSLEFIEQNKEKPFFIYFPHPMPHVPLALSDEFKNKTEQGKYGDVISEIDWSVGQIVAKLKEEGLLDNTIIIFTSDNGPWLNFGKHAGSTGGLREGKGTSWEGGQRVPCVMYWKGHIPKGISCDKIASAIDILPTLAEITGAKLPDKKIDGVSILPLLKAEKNANPRTVFYYYYENNQLQAIRFGDWKLVYPHTYRSYLGVEPGKNGMPGPYNSAACGKELYNLITDVRETTNVIEKYPEIVRQIDSIAEIARQDLGDFLTERKGANVREAGFAYQYQNHIHHKAENAKVLYQSLYSIKYTGGGDSALTDGFTGFSEYSHKAWQGFEGNDLKVVLELKKVEDISEIKLGFLDEEGAWIFKPDFVNIEYSEDGINYKPFVFIKNSDLKPSKIPGLWEADGKLSCKAKYVRVHAKNIGICPENHPGKGLPAWMFVDEIVIM